MRGDKIAETVFIGTGDEDAATTVFGLGTGMESYSSSEQTALTGLAWLVRRFVVPPLPTTTASSCVGDPIFFKSGRATSSYGDGAYKRHEALETRTIGDFQRVRATRDEVLLVLQGGHAEGRKSPPDGHAVRGFPS